MDEKVPFSQFYTVCARSSVGYDYRDVGGRKRREYVFESVDSAMRYLRWNYILKITK